MFSLHIIISYTYYLAHLRKVYKVTNSKKLKYKMKSEYIMIKRLNKNVK